MIRSRKISLIVALVAIPFTLLLADTSGVYSTKTGGTVLTNKASDKAGLHGTASIQDAATVTAFKACQDHGLIATGQDYSVQHATVSLSAAQIIAMYTTPVQLVAAQGAGRSIIVSKLAFTITRTSTAFTGGAAAIVQYDSTANGAGQQALDSTIASTVITGSAGTTVSIRNGAIISDAASTVTQNKGLYISNGTAVFAAGTGTATVDVWYVVY